jgi:hypothetical protein
MKVNPGLAENWRSCSTKAKTFDCVEMMHRGAEEIRKRIRGMAKKEQIEFWRERSEQLQRRQSKAKGKTNTSRPSRKESNGNSRLVPPPRTSRNQAFLGH